MIKIALPTKADSQVDNHFGHCAYFSIVTIEEGQITEIVTLPAPEGCGCKSGIAVTLREMGVSTLLAGNMGEGAKNVLGAQGIRVVRGCSGDIRDIVNAYVAGKIADSGVGCETHHDGCHHHAILK